MLLWSMISQSNQGACSDPHVTMICIRSLNTLRVKSSHSWRREMNGLGVQVVRTWMFCNGCGPTNQVQITVSALLHPLTSPKPKTP